MLRRHFIFLFAIFFVSPLIFQLLYYRELFIQPLINDENSNNNNNQTDDLSLSSVSDPSHGALLYPPYLHPMNRNRTNLQINVTPFTETPPTPKEYLQKLVDAYLAPFSHGFPPQHYEEVLTRTKVNKPEGAKPADRCIMYQVIHDYVYLYDPHKVFETQPQFCKNRIAESMAMLYRLAIKHKLPKFTEFVMCVGDHVQTITNREFRGPACQESRPIFTVPSCRYSHDIPFPVVPDDKSQEGGYNGTWQDAIYTYIRNDSTLWKNKISKAVFRGAFRPSAFYKHREDAFKSWKFAGRGKLAHLGKKEQTFLNIRVGGEYGGKNHTFKRLRPIDFHRFRYILYAEGVSFWSNRLLLQLFGPSAIIKQETPCGQWFEPLLTPFVHYIPTDLLFQNLILRVQWAREHDHHVQEIISAANKFANDFLTTEGMDLYVSLLLKSYTKLIIGDKQVKKREGARSYEELFGHKNRILR